MSFLTAQPDRFKISLEVVPPPDHSPDLLLSKLNAIAHLPFDGFSVASNPVAKPRMSAMAFAHLLRQQTGKPAIVHFTVRDHNRLGIQAELWGARALGIDTVMAVTGDPSARDSNAATVNDLTVFDLIRMAADSGFTTGAVLDYRPETDGLDHEIKRLEQKAAAGCRFIVTQPVYDKATADRIRQGLRHIRVPVFLGILPLLSYKHARFLHDRVAGIAVPDALMAAMEESDDPVQTGTDNSRKMLALAREKFFGACVMPPFERFDILPKIF